MSILLPAVGELYAPPGREPRRVFVVVELADNYRVIFEDQSSFDYPKEPGSEQTPEQGLALAKALAVSQVAQKRDQVASSGADTPSGRVDTTDRSITLIQGLVQLAAIAGQTFNEIFRLADNSDVNVDAPAMIAIGVAVGQFIAAVYRRSWELKAEIDAATSVEELAAIDITAGWP